MRKLTIMMSLLLSVGLFSACSNNDENDFFDGGLPPSEGFNEEPSISFSPSDLNKLQITEIMGDFWSNNRYRGKTDSCWISNPICGLTDPVYVSKNVNENFIDYNMKFTATIKDSPYFTGLQLGIENRENRRIEDMKVGTFFNTFLFNPYNKLSYSIWGNSYSNGGGVLSGRVEVVGKRTASDGTTMIILSLQDLEIKAYNESNWSEHYYYLNGLIEYQISEDGLYPKAEEGGFDMETAVIPSDDLISFMMNALYKSPSEGRKSFFSEAAEEVKCLIINSEQELREVYKGDMEVPHLGINFDHCSLVIGRTYGEHGGISLDDYEFTDNGDSYQLNLTLNNNVNPDYCYTAAFVDLYFWKICPKMEDKPVVFNRIRQDVNIDPTQESSPIRKRWFLQCYSDADGTLRMYDNGWGDERYSIEFKENGRMEGVINTNNFSGYYTLPHMMAIDGKRDGYNGVLHYGLINLTNINVTEVADDEPLSKSFMRIFDATEIKVWSEDIMTIKNSEGEIFGFFRENIKEIYGYK